MKILYNQQPDHYKHRYCIDIVEMTKTVIFKRFLTVWSRTTKTNGKDVEWDVVGKPGPELNCVCIFPYNSKDETVVVIREYHQGTDEIKWGLPAGYYEPKKHDSILDAAKSELSEECKLKNGTLINLLPNGYSELKWVTNKVVPFLVIDPELDESAKALDTEEEISIHTVSIPQLKEMILAGTFTLTSLQTVILALHHLEIPF